MDIYLHFGELLLIVCRQDKSPDKLKFVIIIIVIFFQLAPPTTSSLFQS